MVEPSAERSPEVLWVKNAGNRGGFVPISTATKARFYIFVAGTEGVPSYSLRVAALETTFQHFLLASPDFQDERLRRGCLAA